MEARGRSSGRVERILGIIAYDPILEIWQIACEPIRWSSGWNHLDFKYHMEGAHTIEGLKNYIIPRRWQSCSSLAHFESPSFRT